MRLLKRLITYRERLFQISLNYEYYKSGTDGKWVLINENEYTAGLSNPTKYYYDKTGKKWIEETPPKK